MSRFRDFCWDVFDFFVGLCLRESRILMGEGRLYLGTSLLLLGLFSLRADRFCEGNTELYNACAKPVVYYGYPWWAIACIVVGSVLLLGWWRGGVSK